MVSVSREKISQQRTDRAIAILSRQVGDRNRRRDSAQ
jgi:hypothetical protein